MGRIEHDAPRAAEALGLVETYTYLHGASGKRYLFTSVPEDGLRDYPGAVAVMTAASPRHDRIFWIGEVDAQGFLHGSSLGRKPHRLHTLVHLLARDADSRRQVIRDLRNEVETVIPRRPPRAAAE
ncbi:hypothetical protein C8N35_1011348 [Breoghania corrubedonensis]|uniref:Uncharacterized protein n=1 Tax=Breoghania corrubedonensis TaxID=665038 RepID=A0A2T5VHQ6_9HYPH|nr:hypothetical protein [Breoghania corrubedonensis]PTW63297.1 hypothetical protein C8N35_1011348 [Breoghania corrubedonensis]